MSARLQPKVEVIAHRGLHAEHRENTLGAFEAAIAAGADAIELDVHASADGDVLVHHDSGIPSSGDGPLSISANTTANLNAAANELKFELPTLSQVLERFSGRAKIYIEVKAPDIELMVARVVRTSTADVAVHSFDHRIVKKVRDFVPGVQTGVLTVSRPIHPQHLLRDADASDYWPQIDFVDRDLVRLVHDFGGRVIVWTANLAADWERLISMNVDGLCTDHPDELRQWMGSV